MRPKEMEDLAAFSATEGKRAAAEKRERDKGNGFDLYHIGASHVSTARVLLWGRTVGVKVGGKIIPASFLYDDI